MAKKRNAHKRANGAHTKASVIREVHIADKSLGPTAVAKAAAEKLGIPITPTLVSQASSIINQGGKTKGRKRGRPKMWQTQGHFAGNGTGTLGLAVDFVKQVGGIEQAGTLIATLAAIKQKL